HRLAHPVRLRAPRRIERIARGEVQAERSRRSTHRAVRAITTVGAIAAVAAPSASASASIAATPEGAAAETAHSAKTSASAAHSEAATHAEAAHTGAVKLRQIFSAVQRANRGGQHHRISVPNAINVVIRAALRHLHGNIQL